MEATAPAAEVAAPTGDAPAAVTATAPPTESTISVTPQSEQTAAPASNWSDAFSADNKDYVTNKGFRDAESVLNSYRNLEKLRGVSEDKLLKLPEPGDVDGLKNVYKKLGMPDNPAGYELQTEGRNATTAEWAQNTFHELGLSKEQAHKIMEGFDSFSQQMQADIDEQHMEKMNIEEKDLKKEWGMAFDKNISVARRAAEAFGIDDQTLGVLEQNMGLKQLMKFLNNVGTKMGEDPYVQGSTVASESTLTPNEAKARISNLKKDPEFTQKYLNRDVNAREKMSRLHQMAYPGE